MRYTSNWIFKTIFKIHFIYIPFFYLVFLDKAFFYFSLIHECIHTFVNSKNTDTLKYTPGWFLTLSIYMHIYLAPHIIFNSKHNSTVQQTLDCKFKICFKGCAILYMVKVVCFSHFFLSSLSLWPTQKKIKIFATFSGWFGLFFRRMTPAQNGSIVKKNHFFFIKRKKKRVI